MWRTFIWIRPNLSSNSKKRFRFLYVIFRETTSYVQRSCKKPLSGLDRTLNSKKHFRFLYVIFRETTSYVQRLCGKPSFGLDRTLIQVPMYPSPSALFFLCISSAKKNKTWQFVFSPSFPRLTFPVTIYHLRSKATMVSAPGPNDPITKATNRLMGPGASYPSVSWPFALRNSCSVFYPILVLKYPGGWGLSYPTLGTETPGGSRVHGNEKGS